MYHNYSELIEQLPEEDLLDLVDDERSGQIVQDPPDARMQRVLELGDKVASLIDSYCRGRYQVPFTNPVPDIIIDVSITLHIYRLYGRRRDLQTSEEQRTRYKDSMKTLTHIQDGTIRLFDDLPSPPKYESNKTAYSKTFTESELEKF
jgi:phage gp36-like protein